jgi:O-antigen ligase
MPTSSRRWVEAPPWVLAAALPLLFLHVHYQPGFAIGFGSTEVNVYLSDVAILAVVLTALAVGVREGFAPLRAGRLLWLAMAAFLLWVLVEVALGRHTLPGYAWRTHGVTAAKFVEYALLAPAIPLVLRRRRDVGPPLWALALWSTAATAAGVAQFFGAQIFLAGTVGRRQASFLSSADFAALSAAALLAGLVLLVLRNRTESPSGKALLGVLVGSGALGMVVAGALAAVLGMLTGCAVVALTLALRGMLRPRRLAEAAAVVAVVVLGVVAIRGSDLDAFARFLGASPGSGGGARETKVQTYAHRTLLSYLGIRIFEAHPVTGVGWEGSTEPAAFLPYLADAHRRFPSESPLAFPSADRRYGIQNAWIQALADLGVIGAALWVALFAAGLWLAFRGCRLTALAWICLVGWLWSAQSFVAGIPLDALTWIAFGLAARERPDA